VIEPANVTAGKDDIPNPQERLATIRRLLGQRRADEAAAACLDLAGEHPGSAEPLLLLGKAYQQQGRFDAMLHASQQALAGAPGHPGARLQFAEACIFNGQHDIAVDELGALEASAGSEGDLLQRIAEYYAHLGRHADACRCYERAVALAPEDPRARYNLASAQIALGRLEDAEDNLTRVIGQNPHDYDAWQNRSTLKQQTTAHNHIGALSELLESGDGNDAREVPLCYALAKEYEDLGEYESSFHFLKRGADRRRRMMAYRVDGDVAMMEQLAQVFDERFSTSKLPAEGRRGPLFVTGLMSAR
jgi:tetratricopeptide (TPR) repeat protein